MTMDDTILINNALQVWNKPSNLVDGCVCNISFFEGERIYLDAYDNSGKQIFVDNADFEQGFAEVSE